MQINDIEGGATSATGAQGSASPTGTKQQKRKNNCKQQ